MREHPKISREELAIEVAEKKTARSAARAQWIEENPIAHAAEQKTLAANREIIAKSIKNPPQVAKQKSQVLLPTT